MIIVYIIITVILVVFLFMKKKIFGRTPVGERLTRIINSPNFKDGKFKNLSHTPNLTEGVSYYTVLKELIFSKSKRWKPSQTIPSKKTDLIKLPADQDVLVWFGHSSYFIQIDGKKILVDSVLSGSASPLKLLFAVLEAVIFIPLQTYLK